MCKVLSVLGNGRNSGSLGRSTKDRYVVAGWIMLCLPISQKTPISALDNLFTSCSAVIGLIRSSVRGEKDVRFWKETIPEDRVKTAAASLGLYLTTLAAATYLLTLTEQTGFLELLFEAASALGTVGLSMGITSSLTALGKIIITLTMFIGRAAGPLTFGMALFVKHELIFDDEKTDLAV